MEKIALLIDAENISASYVDEILSKLSLRGEVIIRRAYADWTKAVKKPLKRQADDSYNLWDVLNSWYMTLADHGITPMLQPQNTYGKNSSDIYLVIDAMDLLHEGIVDTFAIVSSDGDFTRLVTRLRAGGKHVIVLGEGQTPRSVKNVADFILLDDPKSTTNSDQNRDNGQATTAVAAKAEPSVKAESSNNKKQNNSKEKQKVEGVAEGQKKQESQKPAVETVAETPKTPKVDAQSYDNEIINSIRDIIAAEGDKVNHEVTYQRLLVVLRKKHPDCEVIKVGESPIELFKKLPQFSTRIDKATYYFSNKPEEIEASENAANTVLIEQPAVLEGETVEANAEVKTVESQADNADAGKKAKKPRQPRKRTKSADADTANEKQTNDAAAEVVATEAVDAENKPQTASLPWEITEDKPQTQPDATEDAKPEGVAEDKPVESVEPSAKAEAQEEEKTENGEDKKAKPSKPRRSTRHKKTAEVVEEDKETK